MNLSLTIFSAVSTQFFDHPCCKSIWVLVKDGELCVDWEMWRNSSDPAYPIIWSGRRVSTDHLEASIALEVADQGLLCLSRHYVHTWTQLRYL